MKREGEITRTGPSGREFKWTLSRGLLGSWWGTLESQVPWTAFDVGEAWSAIGEGYGPSPMFLCWRRRSLEDALARAETAWYGEAAVG